MFGDDELRNMVCPGAITASSVRVWARAEQAGEYVVRLVPDEGAAVEMPISLSDPGADGTGATTIDGLHADTRYGIELRSKGRALARGAVRTAPLDRQTAPRRWRFGAFSCHQPFNEDGSVDDEARAMLQAVHRAYVDADVRFVLMMGDQTYADLPASASLFDEEHFAHIGPPGRHNLLECSAQEIRAIYHRRHRIFFGVPEFARLQSDFACYPMPDDHEIVDNFGSHPDHSSSAWQAVRQGALDAFFDYQGARIHAPSDGRRPASLDYGFVFGSAAIWGFDIRSNRQTSDGHTRVFVPEQLEAMRSFLARTADLPLLVVMTPIPLVHVEGAIVAAASRLLHAGSDLHERWSHPQCRQERDRLVGILYAHSRAHPAQRIVLLGGDVHSGAAFLIDFDGGVQMLQLTSSPVSNREGWIVEKASEQAAHTVSRIAVGDGPDGHASLIRGNHPSANRNPFGGLNAGLVEVADHGDSVTVDLRLLGHDGVGNPVTVFQSGELGRRSPPGHRLGDLDGLSDL